MAAYISLNGSYHEGDELPGDTACQPRPSANYDPDGTGGWVLNVGRNAAAVQADYEAAAQELLDNTAASWQYDNIYTAMTYIMSSVPQFKAEAAALSEWRDALWLSAHQVLAQVLAGTMQIPADALAFVALLPPPPIRPQA